ncbi:U3-containing 90S pre-ribosomal complex subunit-domain containing protein [Infundibulicybe gibba]|nr:U3-containing 90S pre-ribosomal complex subunit-domain containing protein [Infundibulicybe gibba]
MSQTEVSIADTTTWTGPRTLDHLTEFIIQATPTLHTRLAQRSKSNGAPTLLFITGAALRVVDVTRVLKDKKLRGEKGGEVAKLFAKHFKLSEHVTYLKRTKVGAAVGTPGRIGKLLCETDALNVSALSHIIIDVTYRDAKKRSLLDIPETRDEVFRTVLGGHQVLKAIREGKIQIVLF